VNNIRSTLVTIWRIATPYFRSEDKWAARGLLSTVILMQLASVGIDVLINQWRNRFYNALQEKNWDSFTWETMVFCTLAGLSVVLAVYQLYLTQWLQIRWRNWMTTKYLGEWLHGASHYRMQLQGDAADNPDQRISDDVKMFVEQALNLSIGLLGMLISFAIGAFGVCVLVFSTSSVLNTPPNRWTRAKATIPVFASGAASGSTSVRRTYATWAPWAGCAGDISDPPRGCCTSSSTRW